MYAMLIRLSEMFLYMTFTVHAVSAAACVFELCSYSLESLCTLVFVRMYHRLVNVLLFSWYSIGAWFSVFVKYFCVYICHFYDRGLTALQLME